MAAFRFPKPDVVLSQPCIEISSKFGMQIVIHLLKQVPSLNLNPEVDFRLYGRHFAKSMWRHNPALDRLIMTQFGWWLKQNHMPRSKHRSKSKSEVKFQYGGSPFSETGSSFISAVDWDISLKFGTQTDLHLLKRMQSLAVNTDVAFGLNGRHLEKSILRHNSSSLTETKFCMHIDFHYFERMRSLNLNSKVGFRLYDRHLEKSIWRQKSADVCPFKTKFRMRMQHDMRIITHTL